MKYRRALIAVSSLAIAAAALTGATAAQANNPVSGAAFTTVNEDVDGDGHCQNGNPAINCNIYSGKQYVWLNGGPSVAYVGDGQYFFAVLEPGGQADPNDGAAKNLSDDYDAYTNRTFSVSGGTVSYGGSHTFANNKIRLADYADTGNPGGVYILAICSLADGYKVDPSDCKYDAFKVDAGEVQDAEPLTVTKDADGSYKDTFGWTITKDVDKTIVKQVGGSVTFTYTVTVTRDGGTVSDVAVTGTISVTNPNVDGDGNTVPVSGVTVTDTLSDGTVCDVAGGAGATLTAFETNFGYSCGLSALPNSLNNTVTATWPEQFLDSGALLQADSATFTFTGISFTADLVDDCVNVTDTYAGTLASSFCGDPNPKSYHYDRTIPVAPGCHDFDNTARYTTDDTGTTSTASQTVRVCGPLDTGALTIGFWQNKNGQAIIGASKTGVCPVGTWLRQYAPFEDLSATATCAQVQTYVTNVIKAANASGASMNAMLKAQMLATALDVYFSDASLGGNKINAPAPIGGVTIDLTQVCANPATCSKYVDASPAFGGASSKTVLQILAYEASQSNSGGSVWYGQVKSTQELAKDVNDAINNEVAFGP